MPKFPQIYATFKARDKESDEIVDYLIQELPEECFEQALDLLVGEHLPDETLHACRGLVGNVEATAAARDDWRAKLAAKISIACFKSDGSDLVGVNVLGVVSTNDDDEGESSQNEDFRDVVNAFSFIAMQHNVFEAYGVDRYLTDYGLVISRDYRQRGIAGEMLKARVDVTKSLGLAVTSSAFTAVGSQKAAEKAGYKEVFSIEFEEVGKVFTSFDFSQATSASAKILDFKI